MVIVDYVHPNLSPVHLGSKKQRGGLLKRWNLAKSTNCTYIEVPCHLIYNKTEEGLTGLNIGEFLGEKEIEILYSQSEPPENLRYIFHTEPSVGKPNRFGRKIFTQIKWYDETWSNKYLDMIISITRYLGVPPSIIEIHPGDTQNEYHQIASFEELLIDRFQAEYGYHPLILLENRTEQFIATGKQIESYWTYIHDNNKDLVKNIGIVLDIQQLYTKTGDRFLDELDRIPKDCLKGFHIHTKHRCPKLNDPIQWRYVFGIIRELEQGIIINPEIHQKKRVSEAIDFCKKLLSKN